MSYKAIRKQFRINFEAISKTPDTWKQFRINFEQLRSIFNAISMTVIRHVKALSNQFLSNFEHAGHVRFRDLPGVDLSFRKLPGVSSFFCMSIITSIRLYPAELWPKQVLGETTIFWDNYLEIIVIYLEGLHSNAFNTWLACPRAAQL